MASIEVLRGRIRRDELRAAIAACETLAQQRDWRNSNGEIREHIESNPHVRNPKDIAKRFIGRNSAAVRAERIAKPHGGRGKDILREQAEFWLERKLPEIPMSCSCTLLWRRHRSRHRGGTFRLANRHGVDIGA